MSNAGQQVEAHWLRRLTPLNAYSGDALAEIASKTVIEELPAGRRLFLQGQHDHWTFYLVSGTLGLGVPHQPLQTLRDTDAGALSPLAPQLPRRVTAITLSAVKFIRIDNGMLEMLRPQPVADQIEVGEILDTGANIDDQVFIQFYQDYMDNKLVLPSLPDIAVRVRKAVQNPDNGPNEVAKIIQADAGLTTQVLQVANSSLYRGHSPVSTLRLAITRLGMETTRNIATSFALQQLFTSKSRVLKQELLTLWQHSAKVAAISFTLARKTPGQDPDRALLAGLIHDVGALPVINHAERFPRLLEHPQDLNVIITKLKPQIGAMILRKWQFPTDLVTVALEAEDWRRNPDKTADLCDLILVAQIHSFLGTPSFQKCPRLDDLPAFQKIALGRLTPEQSMQIMADSADEIKEMMRLLGANG